MNDEEIRAAWDDKSNQLYAKEAENYFFYYQPENETVKFWVMKEILIIPFLLAFLFFGVVLYAAETNRHAPVQKGQKHLVVKAESFELKPSVIVI